MLRLSIPMLGALLAPAMLLAQKQPVVPQGQTKKALENVQRVVEAAGGTMAGVLKCTVFLIDAKDFAGMNTVYRQAFPSEPPARSTVVVAALVSPAARVEIECIAALPHK